MVQSSTSNQKPVVVPDTGKRGVQPIGTVNPLPPRPTPPPPAKKPE
jgi:hypothetical protein